MFHVIREKHVHRNICQKIKRADNFDIQTAFSLRLSRLRPLLADCYATQRFFHTSDLMENIWPYIWKDPATKADELLEKCQKVGARGHFQSKNLCCRFWEL